MPPSTAAVKAFSPSDEAHVVMSDAVVGAHQHTGDGRRGPIR